MRSRPNNRQAFPHSAIAGLQVNACASRMMMLPMAPAVRINSMTGLIADESTRCRSGHRQIPVLDRRLKCLLPSSRLRKQKLAALSRRDTSDCHGGRSGMRKFGRPSGPFTCAGWRAAGPELNRPAGSGFGTRLISTVMPKSRVAFDYAPAGLRYVIDFPIAAKS